MEGHGCVYIVTSNSRGELVWAGRGEISRGHFVNRYKGLSDGEIMPKFIPPQGESSRTEYHDALGTCQLQSASPTWQDNTE
jgi:hypothetical protein